MDTKRNYEQSACGGNCKRCDYKNLRTDTVFTIEDEMLLKAAIDSTDGTEFSIEPTLQNLQTCMENENHDLLKQEIKDFYCEVGCPLPDNFCSILRCTAYLNSFAEKLFIFLLEKEKEPVETDSYRYFE